MGKSEFSIARDFSRNPGPRHKWQGPHSGELLRERLIKLLSAQAGKIIILLDGTTGIGSSFLDEAFGGLIKHAGFTHDIRDRFDFVSKTDPSYIVTISDSFDRAVADKTVH